MNSKSLTLLLIAICAILGNLIYYNSNHQPTIVQTNPIGSPEELSLKKTPSMLEPELGDIDDFDEIIQRPLFSVTRQEEDEQIIEEKNPAQRPARDPNLKLVGIVLSGEDQIALIKARKDPKLKRVKLNEKIEGWTLKELKNNSVKLISGRQEITLEMSRRSDPKKRPTLNKPKNNKQPFQKNDQPFRDLDEVPDEIKLLAPGSPVTDVGEDDD